ncbi:MAG: dihydroorotate dehydrogenase electron transfer subunit [Candidatus Nanoarchaeia archaeon]|nr:dihydroorotate dehydrogenase electron transfer subunit [Candidatus Nanoarchaeia archaeon]
MMEIKEKSRYKKIKIKEIKDENHKTKTFFFDCGINISPGQFIMLWLPDVDEKPFAVSYKKPMAVTVELKGCFTKELFNLKKGDELFYRGPLGKGFTIYEKKAIVVAGGMGLAGLSTLIESLGNPKVVFGCKCKNDLFFRERFDMNLCTDDGSQGYKGFATKKLREIIEKEKYEMIYACGPEIMMKQIFDIAEQLNIDFEASLERFMFCGVGICGSCACGKKLVCKDGPVFNSKQLREMNDFGRYAKLKSGKRIEINKCNSKTTAINNGMVFIDGKLDKKNILIQDGIIKEVSENEFNANKVIDASEKIVLPGIIDSHVHMREPGHEYKEDFFTGSCTAAAGGITTFIDMPNNKKPIISFEDLERKRELAKKSIVNYGFYFGTNGENIDEFKKVKNVAALKIYMDKTTGNLLVNDYNKLNNIFINFERIAIHGEHKNIEKAIKLAIKHNNHLQICHVSSKKEIDIIRKYKQGKNNIYVEVTPHHLFLTKYDEKNSFFLMKPELKTKQDQDALWGAIDEGIIDRIGTDHAPHTKDEKNSDNPPYGIPGLETMLPLLLDAVNKGKLSLSKLVKLTVENPVKMFNIKNKGRIKQGFDADLTIVDMNKEKTVKNEELFTKCKWSAWNEKKFKGWPLVTIVNGNIVFENQRVNDIKGREINFN